MICYKEKHWYKFEFLNSYAGLWVTNSPKPHSCCQLVCFLIVLSTGPDKSTRRNRDIWQHMKLSICHSQLGHVTCGNRELCSIHMVKNFTEQLQRQTHEYVYTIYIARDISRNSIVLLVGRSWNLAYKNKYGKIGHLGIEGACVTPKMLF